MADKGFDALSWADYDNETGRSRVHTAVLTAANFDAQATLRSAYHVAIAGIVNGVLTKTEFGNVDHPFVGPSEDETAQRELKWLVQYHNTTTNKKYRVELPCADMAQLDPNDRAHAHIGDAGVVDAFVTAFEAFVKPEDNPANAVEVDEITLVGRRL